MRISDKDKLIFTKNIAVMLTSGIPLVSAVRSLTVQAANPSFARVCATLAGDIQAGQRFSLALERHPAVFDAFYVNVVRAGEKAGSLERNLEYIASHIESRIAFQRSLKSALLYPAVLLCAVAGAAVFFAYFILPAITDLIVSFEGEPPLAAKMILFVSGLIADYGALMLAVFIAMFAFLVFFAQSKGGREVVGRFSLVMPIFGNIFRQIQLAEVAAVLSTLLKSGVPAHESLQITAQSVRNPVYQKAIARIIPGVLKGSTISAFLDRRLFPPLFMQMMEVGEQSARIEQNLDYLADFYQKDVANRMKNILTLIEPVLLIIVGIAVLLLALAILGPIYQIAGN